MLQRQGIEAADDRWSRALAEIVARLRGVLARAGVPDESPPASPAPEATPDAERIEPWLLRRPYDATVPTIAVAVFGLEPPELERTLDAVLEAARRGAFVPVFLTDRRDLEPFRRRCAPFEYLPRAPAAGDDVAAWRIYVLRRLALWRRKWRLARVVSVGGEARRVLETWRRSPYLDPDVAALLTPSPDLASGA